MPLLYQKTLVGARVLGQPLEGGFLNYFKIVKRFSPKFNFGRY
jgi:hypothetical protein